MARRKSGTTDPASAEFVQEICALYGDCYDDRLEDSRPPVAGKKNGRVDKRVAGNDWQSGIPAAHKSLSSFQKELAEKHDIHLSTSKIRKILISGGRWTTERSREIQALYAESMIGDSNIIPDQVVATISKQLGIGMCRKKLMEYTDNPKILEICRRDILISIAYLSEHTNRYR